VSAPIILVSCVKSKRDDPCRASEMYTSALFQKMMAYARSLNPKFIFILSAKYGLLSLEEIIDPYEQTLKTMNTAGRLAWLHLRKRVIRTANGTCQICEASTDKLECHESWICPPRCPRRTNSRARRATIR
jgi:hypothetical protein